MTTKQNTPIFVGGISSERREWMNRVLNYVNPFSELIYGLNRAIDILAKKADVKDYWNYIQSKRTSYLYEMLIRLAPESFTELGSGYPLISYTAKIIIPNLRVVAYELDKDICKFTDFHFRNSVNENNAVPIVNKNILELTEGEIQQNQVLFYYVPIKNGLLMKKFVELLIKHTKIGQIIIFNPNSDNYSEGLFSNSPKFARMTFDGMFEVERHYRAFKRIK